MAAINVDHWVPEEYGSEVLQRVNQNSAVETFGREEPMGSATKSVPRSGGASVGVVAKSGAYAEDATANDEVILTARKFGQVFRIADEDLNDTLVSVLATKQKDWAVSYAKLIDNACLAVTAASNGGTVPFTSVYKAITTDDTNVSYTANTNRTQTGTGGTSYANLSSTLAKVEQGDFFDESRIVIAAHPAFKDKLRGIKDSNQRPIFVEGTSATPATLFGYPIVWTNGAKTSAVATPTPAGNPLLIVVNRDFLILGKRSGPESAFIDANGAGVLTDEAILKMRARRGFALGNPFAAAVLEDNS